MQRKDVRAIKYWARGLLTKPTSQALSVRHDSVWCGGRLLAVRRKALTGETVIWVDSAKKHEIDFGGTEKRPVHVIGRDNQALHELQSIFENYDRCVEAASLPRGEDVLRLSRWVDTIQKKTKATRETSDKRYFRFVPEGDPVRVALTLRKHRFGALAWTDVLGQKLTPESGISERVLDSHLLFFNFEDAVLLKLKSNNIKVVPL